MSEQKRAASEPPFSVLLDNHSWWIFGPILNCLIDAAMRIEF